MEALFDDSDDEFKEDFVLQNLTPFKIIHVPLS